MSDLRDLLFKRPFAHRGLHDLSPDRPENSRAAFLAAIDADYGIEMDIQMSGDGQAMVFHDYELSRLTNVSGPIRQRTAAELQKLHIFGGKETIPTLAQVLELVAGRAPLLIEIKDQDGALGPETCGLEAAVARVVQGYDGPAAVMSFNPHSVRYMSALLPDTPRGLVSGPFTKEAYGLVPEATRTRLRNIPDFDAIGAEFLSHDVADLDREPVKKLRASGIPVLSWTIKSKSAEEKARKSSDNITFQGYLPDHPMA